MAQHSVIKEWVNGYELSIAIDDNLNGTFRYDIVLFQDNINIEHRFDIGSGRNVISMAEDILKAYNKAKGLPKGDVPEFERNVKAI